MSLGSLVVSLTADISEFTADLGKAAHISEKTMNRMKKDAEQAGKAIGAAFAAGVVAAAAMTRAAINAADRLDEMAQSAGTSVEALSALGYAASFSGVNTETLSTSLSKLNRNISETAAGTGEAREAFQALGINVKDSGGNLKTADQVLKEVANRFAGMEDGAGKSALAIQLFGRSGAQMIPTLNLGAAGLEAMRLEAEQLGQIISTDTAKAAADLNDNLQKLTSTQRALGNAIMIEVLPLMTALTNSMIQAAKDGDAFKESGRGIKMVLEALLKAGSVAWFMFQGLGKTMAAVAATIAAMSEASSIKTIGGIWVQWAEDVKRAKQETLTFIDTVNTGATAAKNFRDNFDRETMGAMAKGKAPQLVNKEQLAQEINDLKGYVKQYEEAIQLQVDLTKEAEAQGVLTRQEAILHTAALEDARLQTIIHYLKQEQKLYADQKDMAKARVADIKIQAAEADRVANAVRTEARAKTAQQQEEERLAEIGYAHEREILQQMEHLRTLGLTEREVLTEEHEKKLEWLRQAREREYLTEEEYRKRIEELELQHRAKLGDITAQGELQRRKFIEMSWDAQARTIFGEIENITRGVAQHNRVLFNINKVAGIANAILNAHVGITKTLATYPYPWNIAMAALHGVAAFAQVQAIARTQFGTGSSTAPSLAGSTGAPPVTPVEAGGGAGRGAGQTTIIQLRGEVFSRDQLRKLIEQLNENTEDGGRIVVA